MSGLGYSSVRRHRSAGPLRLPECGAVLPGKSASRTMFARLFGLLDYGTGESVPVTVLIGIAPALAPEATKSWLARSSPLTQLHRSRLARSCCRSRTTVAPGHASGVVPGIWPRRRSRLALMGQQRAPRSTHRPQSWPSGLLRRRSTRRVTYHVDIARQARSAGDLERADAPGLPAVQITRPVSRQLGQQLASPKPPCCFAFPRTPGCCSSAPSPSWSSSGMRLAGTATEGPRRSTDHRCHGQPTHEELHASDVRATDCTPSRCRADETKLQTPIPLIC